MSDTKLQSRGASEDTGKEDRQVPVTEAIRYRRRAQQAEKELAEMKAERDFLQTEKQTLSDQLNRIQQDQRIRELLTGAGATDPETALLLVRDRLASSDQTDAQKAVEQLRKEKSWLFAPRHTGGSWRTAGIRHRPDGSALLHEAARKAAQTGHENDVQEYLRLRRQGV